MSKAEITCRACGAAARADAKFCGSCGSALVGGEFEKSRASVGTGISTPTEPVESPSGSIESGTEGDGQTAGETGLSQDAGEFAQALRAYANLPGVQLAGIASLIGIGVVLAFAFLLAVLLPDNSFLSLDLEDSGLLREVMAQAAGTSLSGIEFAAEGESFSLHAAPLLFFLVPIAGVALGSFLQLSKEDALSGKAALIAAAATGIPFAILMAIAAFIASGEVGDGLFDFNVPVSSTFLLSLCAGVIGGAIGALLAARQNGSSSRVFPAQVERHVGTMTAIFKPLGLLLVVTSLIGAGVWSVQSIRDVADARGDRGVGTAVVDSLAFSGDLGIRNVGLGTLASFELTEFANTASTPLPVSVGGEKLSELADDGKFQLFDYKDVMSAWAFVPLALLLITIPALLALYAGFLVGRSRPYPDPKFAAAWGALVGPTWAFSLVILNALSVELAFGHMLGDSVFAGVLIGGAILGVVGSLLGVQTAIGTSAPNQKVAND